MTIKLIGFKTSPWTEKARWALDARHIEYHYEEYVPLISEPSLRLRLKQLNRKVTVPVLLRPKQQGKPLMDSYDIARWAQRYGGGEDLFPAQKNAQIAHINADSERLLALVRARFTINILDNEDAKREQLPAFIPQKLYGMANLGLWYLVKKYDLEKQDDTQLIEKLTPILQSWRTQLGDKDTILDQWSYADIIVASTLNFIKPHISRSGGPASDQCQTIEPLAELFNDLCLWRDTVYEKRR